MNLFLSVFPSLFLFAAFPTEEWQKNESEGEAACRRLYSPAAWEVFSVCDLSCDVFLLS